MTHPTSTPMRHPIFDADDPEFADLSEHLTDDGDTFDFADGQYRLKLIVRPDEDSSVNDYDADGKVEWISRRDVDSQRPEGFDGAAMKLWAVQNGDQFWWQPWEGYLDLTDEEKRKAQYRMCELMAFGFSVIGLRLYDGCTNCGSWSEMDTIWIGGVDELYPELITEQLAELFHQVNNQYQEVPA